MQIDEDFEPFALHPYLGSDTLWRATVAIVTLATLCCFVGWWLP